MKGIVLAGGSGTRLYPLTKAISKQLLPIGDKPMIYYPISVLMMAGIKDILVITTPHDSDSFKRLLGDGSNYGISLSYAEQPKPNGIAEAFIIGKDFIGGDQVALILGDNIFYGVDFKKILLTQKERLDNGAIIFGYRVSDPHRFGVVEFDKKDNVLSIEEKPTYPKSKYAVVGLYFYDRHVCDLVKDLKPSKRGELEISDLNQLYLNKKSLSVVRLDEGFTWLDTGTHKSLTEASQFVNTIEERQDIKIGCLEEIAYLNQWLDKNQFKTSLSSLTNTPYGKYLSKIYRNENNRN